MGERLFEDNIIYDDEEGSLASRRCVLRLRKSDRATLTFKLPIEKSTFKVMEEFETEVSNFEGMHQILCRLGYKKAFRYQKYRETASFEHSKVSLDRTPIGDFVEIEGEEKEIRKIAGLLRLKIEDGTSKNYHELYLDYCGERSASPGDMVFKNGSEP